MLKSWLHGPLSPFTQSCSSHGQHTGLLTGQIRNLDWEFWQKSNSYQNTTASLIAQLVKNPPAMKETPVWFLDLEDPLEKGRLPTSVFWPGEFHGLYSPWGHKESDMTERLSRSLLLDLERCKQDYLSEKVSLFYVVLGWVRNIFCLL